MPALRCGGARRALRHVVLVVIAASADTPVPARDLDVVRGVVLCEVDAKLLVILQRLVLPWDLLVGVEQMPAVVAHGLPANVCAQVARRVAVVQQVVPRLRLAAVAPPPRLLARCQVANLARALPASERRTVHPLGKRGSKRQKQQREQR